jgi:hypothetical protein
VRYELSDFEWAAIKPLLPNKSRGVRRVNDRRVLNGIFGSCVAIWKLEKASDTISAVVHTGWSVSRQRFRWTRSGCRGKSVNAEIAPERDPRPIEGGHPAKFSICCHNCCQAAVKLGQIIVSFPAISAIATASPSFP